MVPLINYGRITSTSLHAIDKNKAVLANYTKGNGLDIKAGFT
jgi:hypothetical protein